MRRKTEFYTDMLACPCCGYETLDEIGIYDICPICFWEDSPVQRHLIDQGGGPNPMSLLDAQANYRKIGACEISMKCHVREPLPSKNRHLKWKPLSEIDEDFQP